MDVTQDASVNTAVEQALSRAGRIDVVINNAGIGALGVTVGVHRRAVFSKLMDVNLFGAVRVNRAVLPAMRKRRSGLIIHVSSAAGRAGAALHGGLLCEQICAGSIRDAYRFELSPFGIDSVIVEPGIHRTPILSGLTNSADQVRVGEYGLAADYARRIKSVLRRGKSLSSNPRRRGRGASVRAADRNTRGRAVLSHRANPVGIQALLQPYNAAAGGPTAGGCADFQRHRASDLAATRCLRPSLFIPAGLPGCAANWVRYSCS